jgi:hypothetical protein
MRHAKLIGALMEEGERGDDDHVDSASSLATFQPNVPVLKVTECDNAVYTWSGLSSY